MTVLLLVWTRRRRTNNKTQLRSLVVLVVIWLLLQCSCSGYRSCFLSIKTTRHKNNLYRLVGRGAATSSSCSNNNRGGPGGSYHHNRVFARRAAIRPGGAGGGEGETTTSPQSVSLTTTRTPDVSRRRAWERCAGVAGAAATTATTMTASGLLLPSNYKNHNNRLLVPSAAAAADETMTTSTTTTATSKVPTVSLGSSGLTISRTIQGTWQLAGGHGRYKESDALANMEAHYRAGMTTLDTADIYGPSELIVGKFVRSHTSGSGDSQQQQTPTAVVPCTKFCCFRFLEDITRDEVRERVQRAAERLQVSKLPLVQFFWSNYDVKKYVEVGLWLTELKEEENGGLIGEIGATNFDLPRLQELTKAGVPLVSHQVQLSAMDQRSIQSGMADWCVDNDVRLIAFGTVGSGILSDLYLGRDVPPSAKERKSTASMRMYGQTAERFGDWSLVQELLRTMRAVADQVRADGRCPTATVSNIAQRYVLQCSAAVAAIVVGIRNQDHLVNNVQTHSFSLNQDEMDTITKVISKRSGPAGDVWDLERGTLRSQREERAKAAS